MLLACYKIKDNPYATWLDRVIAFFSDGVYSHVEIVFDRLDIEEKAFSINYNTNKPRFTTLGTSDIEWDFVEVKGLQKDKEMKALYECKRLNMFDIKYDYIGAMFSIFRPKRDLYANKYFCSELCSMILIRIGIELELEPQQYTPVSLAKEIKNMEG